MSPQVALQTFTIRKHIKSPKEIERALLTIEALGIHAIELARIEFTPQEIEKIVEVCSKIDMKVGSVQLKYKFMIEHFDWTVEMLNKMNCKYPVVSVIPMSVFWGSKSDVVQFANDLNALGEKFKAQDLTLLYHHHHFEFVKKEGIAIFDLLLESLNPDYVGFCLDTYWLQLGGMNPPDVIRQLNSRVKVVHLRDYALKLSRWKIGVTDTALGNGRLDFKKIVEACQFAEVSYMAIEQDTKTPYESIGESIKYLKTLEFSHLFKEGL